MSKRSLLTNITPLPPGVPRELAVAFLHDHLQMIDLNPLVESREACKPPPKASHEEFHCSWYQITDVINYGLYKGKTKYYGCFHDLPDGLQTHILAPAGLEIRGRWSVGGSLPGEVRQPVEIGLGIPKDGLYIREDVDMKCNIMLTAFVKKNLQKSHKELVDTLIMKTRGQGTANEQQLRRSQTITTQRVARREEPPPYDHEDNGPAELDSSPASIHLPAELESPQEGPSRLRY